MKKEIKGIFNWGSFFYGYREYKRGNKYYRSHNARYDDTCGGTEEITSDEYSRVAIERAKTLGLR